MRLKTRSVVSYDTPESARLPTRSIDVEIQKMYFGILLYFFPARPVGPPVARSDVVPSILDLEIGRRTSLARAEPTAASVSPKLAPCKSLSECCTARAGRPGAEPRWVVGWSLRLGIGRRTSPAPAKPTAGRALLKLVSNKSLSECCAGPK